MPTVQSMGSGRNGRKYACARFFRCFTVGFYVIYYMVIAGNTITSIFS